MIFKPPFDCCSIRCIKYMTGNKTRVDKLSWREIYVEIACKMGNVQFFRFSNEIPNIICYSGSWQGISPDIPCLCSIFPEPSGSGNIEHRQGISGDIPCQARITFIFYLSVIIYELSLTVILFVLNILIAILRVDEESYLQLLYSYHNCMTTQYRLFPVILKLPRRRILFPYFVCNKVNKKYD